ncbi:MAG TPA: class I SAM-dependent methyltransferase [Acidimicrobiales bacterium]
MEVNERVGQTGRVVDHQFSDIGLASLYDVLHPWDQRDDLDFYLELVMTADAVLDVGCGTGALLHRARESGHTGRLCGLDPAVGMLAQARRRSDIEWVLGDLASAHWERELDLTVMTGHAVQVLVEDDDLHSSLGAVRAALNDEGRFVFETRNPLVRAWEGWIPDNATEMNDGDGTVVRMAHQVESPVIGDIVRFTTTYTSPDWDRPEESQSTLRFLDANSLSRHLSDAGLGIEKQFGNWSREPLTESSPEIITIARPV